MKGSHWLLRWQNSIFIGCLFYITKIREPKSGHLITVIKTLGVKFMISANHEWPWALSFQRWSTNKFHVLRAQWVRSSTFPSTWIHVSKRFTTVSETMYIWDQQFSECKTQTCLYRDGLAPLLLCLHPVFDSIYQWVFINWSGDGVGYPVGCGDPKYPP